MDRERKISPRLFCPNFFCTPWGHGRPRAQVMDVRIQMLVFQDFEGLSEVFDPGRPQPCPETFSLGCFFVPEWTPRVPSWTTVLPFFVFW